MARKYGAKASGEVRRPCMREKRGKLKSGKSGQNGQEPKQRSPSAVEGAEEGGQGAGESKKS